MKLSCAWPCQVRAFCITHLSAQINLEAQTSACAFKPGKNVCQFWFFGLLRHCFEPIYKHQVKAMVAASFFFLICSFEFRAAYFRTFTCLSAALETHVNSCRRFLTGKIKCFFFFSRTTKWILWASISTTNTDQRPCRTNKLLFHCCLKGLKRDWFRNEKKIEMMFP